MFRTTRFLIYCLVLPFFLWVHDAAGADSTEELDRLLQKYFQWMPPAKRNQLTSFSSGHSKNLDEQLAIALAGGGFSDPNVTLSSDRTVAQRKVAHFRKYGHYLADGNPYKVDEHYDIQRCPGVRITYTTAFSGLAQQAPNVPMVLPSIDNKDKKCLCGSRSWTVREIDLLEQALELLKKEFPNSPLLQNKGFIIVRYDHLSLPEEALLKTSEPLQKAQRVLYEVEGKEEAALNQEDADDAALVAAREAAEAAVAREKIRLRPLSTANASADGTNFQIELYSALFRPARHHHTILVASRLLREMAWHWDFAYGAFHQEGMIPGSPNFDPNKPMARDDNGQLFADGRFSESRDWRSLFTLNYRNPNTGRMSTLDLDHLDYRARDDEWKAAKESLYPASYQGISAVDIFPSIVGEIAADYLLARQPNYQRPESAPVDYLARTELIYEEQSIELRDSLLMIQTTVEQRLLGIEAEALQSGVIR